MGTGSIAIALEHFGCLCIGSDIDPRILRGEMYAGYNGNNRQDINEKILPAALRKDSHSSSDTSLLQSSSASSTPPVPAIVSVAQEEEKTDRADTNKKNKKQQPSFSYRTDYHPRKVNGDVRSNFHQYSLPIPDLIRMDHHLLNRHLHSFVRKNFFDIIVTDPPYGIRAGARKSGKKEQVDYSISQEKRIDHIPSTQAYPVEEVMLDLLHTAAETLRLGGILVYLIPTAYNFELKDLPHHPCLQLIDSCHQPLSARHGRRAVIMRKARENTANLAEEFQVYKERVMSGQDDGFGLLLKKLITALQADAFDNDIVVKRLGSCCERRKESRERRRKQREEGIVFPVKHPFPKLGKKAQKLRLGVSDIPSNEEELAFEEVDEDDLSSGSDQIDSFEQR